jgi:hypothetical protein
MTEATFNPDAMDGDGDGIVQEGTPFERSIEEIEVNPVEEALVVEEATEEVPEEAVEPLETTEENKVITGTPDVISSPEAEEEVSALLPVADGVIGAGKLKKTKPAAKKQAVVKEDAPSTVALFSARNIAWQGVGKLTKGYNIVSAEVAEKWTTLDSVRLVTPEEVRSNLG